MSNEAIYSKDITGATALQLAVAMNQVGAVKELLLLNSELANVIIDDKYTSLHYATWHGQEEIVKIMLPCVNGSIINFTDSEGMNIFHLAAQKGRHKIMELLLIKDEMKSVNNIDDNGSTPLHYASYNNYAKIVIILLAQMTIEAINTRDSNGYTALAIANIMDYKDIADLIDNFLGHSYYIISPHKSDILQEECISDEDTSWAYRQESSLDETFTLGDVD